MAPCGIPLFGGNATWEKANADIGQTLRYESRFVPYSPTDDSVGAENVAIADREFNVKSIARVAIGPNSIVDVRTASPNKFSCVLAPSGSGSNLLNVDLITLKRQQERISDTQFDCSEVVSEIISPLNSPSTNNPSSTAPILKEIETASLYTYDPSKDQIFCRQRSASFLLPSQSNPVALRLWQASGGRPVDVRFYDVVYTKRS